MASCNLACALAMAGDLPAAASALREAAGLNADLSANAARDPDLTPLRDAGPT